MSMKIPPNVVINDISGMTAAHMQKRSPGFFNPNNGRVATPSEENISAAEKGQLKVSLPFLKYGAKTASVQQETDHKYCSTNVHPLTGSSERYCLTDEFHKKNVKTRKDKLRESNLVVEIAGSINTQVQEQLFRGTKRDLYFLNMMKPLNYLFTLRLLLHLQNDKKNLCMKSKLMDHFKALFGHIEVTFDEFGRLCVSGKCIYSG
jgi:hypothetical protein